MQALVGALSQKRVVCDVKLTELVKLFRGGEPEQMSKRAGEFVTLRDVVDEVGPDVVRFIMLYRKNDAPLDFDFGRSPSSRATTRCSTCSMRMRRSARCSAMPSLELGESINERSFSPRPTSRR